MGTALANPLSSALAPIVLIATTTMYSASSGAMEDKGNYLDAARIATYDFGELGKAEIYDTQNEATLRNLFERMNISPEQDLSAYLDKKVVLFQLKAVSDSGMVATFKFNQNDRIYFPSGTTRYFELEPERFGVFITAPREYVYETVAPLRPVITNIGRDEQYLTFATNRYDTYYGRRGASASNTMVAPEYEPELRSPSNYPIYMHDIILEKKGIRTDSVRAAVSGIVDPFILGIILGTLVFVLLSILFLFLIKSFSVLELIKFIAYGLALWVSILFLWCLFGIFGFALQLAFVFSSVLFNGINSIQPNIVLSGLGFVLIPFGILLVVTFSMGVIAWLFITYKKNDKKWIRFSRKHIVFVSVVSGIVSLVLAWLITLLP